MLPKNNSHYQKIAQDAHTTTLRHKDGHTITIAHKALKPEHMAELASVPMMYGGGQTAPADPEKAKAVSSAFKQNSSDKAITEAVQHPINAITKMFGMYKGSDPKSPDYLDPNAQQPATIPGVDTPPAETNMSSGPVVDTNPVTTSLDKSVFPNSLNVPNDDAQDKPPSYFDQTMTGSGRNVLGASAAGANLINKPPAMDASPSSNEENAQPQKAASGNNLMPQTQTVSGRLEADLAQQKAGMQGQADAASALGSAESDANEAAHGQMMDLKGRSEIETGYVNQELDAARKAYADGKIDPEHWMNNHSRVATAIGLMLGGLGTGGNGNGAMKFLQDSIQRDVDAQVQNRGAQKNLIDAVQKKYDNIQQQRSVASGFITEGYKAAIDKAVANNRGPQAQAVAQQMKAALDAQQAPLNAQVGYTEALRKMATQPGGQAQTEQLVPGMVPEKEQEKALGEAGEYQRYLDAKTAADKMFSQMQVEQTLGNYTDPQSYIRNKALHANMVQTIMDISPSKRLTETSVGQEIDPMMSGTFTNSGTADYLRKQLQDQLDKHKPATPTLNAYRVPLKTYKDPHKKME